MTTKTSIGLACVIAAATATASVPAELQSLLSPSTLRTSISPIIKTPDNIGTRETSLQEKLIGEIRSWILLDNDWDGEGALKPFERSVKESVAFLSLVEGETILSFMEPMLLSSGHISLFLNEMDLYADIEFLGNKRIAYFIKKDGDKHKGVLEFNSQQMPSVFTALLQA